MLCHQALIEILAMQFLLKTESKCLGRDHKHIYEKMHRLKFNLITSLLILGTAVFTVYVIMCIVQS